MNNVSSIMGRLSFILCHNYFIRLFFAMIEHFQEWKKLVCRKGLEFSRIQQIYVSRY